MCRFIGEALREEVAYYSDIVLNKMDVISKYHRLPTAPRCSVARLMLRDPVSCGFTLVTSDGLARISKGSRPADARYTSRCRRLKREDAGYYVVPPQ